MPAQATMVPPQQLIDAAKALFLAYNDKNWTAMRAAITPDFVYDEVATARKVQGADEVIAVWQGWATAIPDSRATFHHELASGNNMVVLEHTWSGTHSGPLETPTGTIPATGKRIDLRACAVIEIAGDKVRLQRHYFDMATLLRQLGANG
jgi:steroid delta-isomerase-like uncharacterized protein